MWEYPRARVETPVGVRVVEDPEFLRTARALARLSRRDFLEHIRGMDAEREMDALRYRFRYDVEWFLRYCWPSDFKLPFNAFQRWFVNRPRVYWEERIVRMDSNDLNVTAAPRGNAKTTLSIGRMLNNTAYGLEPLSLVFSADLKKGSEPIMETILSMAQESEEFASLYGKVKLTHHKDLRALEVGENPSQVFGARSFKVMTRGIRFKNQRPTYILIDDGEHPTRVMSAENRKKDFAYLKGDILKSGPPGGVGMFVDWVGTVLARDAILPTLLREPGWKGRIWKAISQWSTDAESLAKWEECHEVWADLSNHNRLIEARAFYEANREVMHRGWKVTDPVTWPLYRLHVAMWTEGMLSFMRERQNEASLSEYAFFDVSKFRRFAFEHRNGELCVVIHTPSKGAIATPVRELRKIAYLDPVPGSDLGSMSDGAGAGDFAAIAVLGKDRNGFVYFLDWWMKRARDSEQVEVLWELCEQWEVGNAAVESNGFARLITRDFRRAQKERELAGRFYKLNVIEDKVSSAKNERIASIQPAATEQGWLRFREDMADTPEEHQFADFPNGAHDDIPDAAAGAYRLLGGSAVIRRESKLTYRS